MDDDLMILDQKVRGFYFDNQIMNPLYTVTLHPNTRPVDEGKDIIWKDPSQLKPDDPSKISNALKRDKHYDKKWSAYLTDGYKAAGEGPGTLEAVNSGDNSTYYAEPICSSIFSEDFSFSVTNDWGNFDGGNAIEGIFNKIKPWAPFAGKAAKGLSEAVKSMNGDNFGSQIAGTLTDWAGTIGDAAGSLETYLNKALYVQGTRFVTYNGTSTNFSGINMKFTMLSDWRQYYPGEKDYHFVTVFDQLNMIYPYFMGFYQQDQGSLGWLTKKISNETVRTTVDKFINEYVGWQSPPGGFKAKEKNIDTQQRGTLRMMFGGYYTLDNLLIKNISFNFSKQLCKNPDKEGELVPMYADVNIELMPASVYTDAKLGEFLNSSGMLAIHEALKVAKNPEKNKENETKAQTQAAKAKK